MSDEYIIRLDQNESVPSAPYLEEILKTLPGYFGRVQYPEDVAFEFRSEGNRDPKKMPDLAVICRSHDVVISSNGPAYLKEVMAALVLEFVRDSRAEHIEVLRP